MLTPVLLDTDIGTDVDDALALGLVLASPELELCAVTTVAGKTVVRARIAKKLLTLGSRPDIPVGAGIQEPLLRRRPFVWLGHEGRGIVKAGEALELEPVNGVELLLDVARHERPHVVAIGPLTNLAEAITKEPEARLAIAHLTVMGGWLGRDRTLPGVAFDDNLASDPEASMLVLDAGIPTTIVPLDVTWRVYLTGAERRRLRWARSRLARTLGRAIDAWAPQRRDLLALAPGLARDAVAFLHDPLAVAVLVDRSLCGFETLPLRPRIDGDGFRLEPDPAGHLMNVATTVDAPRVVRLLMDRLLALR